MADDKQYYHDKGEQDGSDGVYEPPITLGDTFYKMSDSDIANNEAYDKGYKNARDQKR